MIVRKVIKLFLNIKNPASRVVYLTCYIFMLVSALCF